MAIRRDPKISKKTESMIQNGQVDSPMNPSGKAFCGVNTI